MICRTLIKIIVAINLILGFAGCILPENEDDTGSIIISGDFQYDVYAPERDYKLPGALGEISGLA